MASKTPTWVWVLLGIVGFFVLAGIGLVAGGVLMVRSHVHSELAEKQTADQEFARQTLENATALDPNFALAYAAIANVCAQHYYRHGREQIWLDRAKAAAPYARARAPADSHGGSRRTR